MLRVFKSIRYFSNKISIPSQLNNNPQYSLADQQTKLLNSENEKSFGSAELNKVEGKEVQKLVDIDMAIR